MKKTKAKSKDGIAPALHVPELPQFEDIRLVERHGGYFWQSLDGKRERGPFATLEDAEEDLQVVDEETLEVGETLQEAESEIGIAEWMDPDTGEPAEESVSRIEEH